LAKPDKVGANENAKFATFLFTLSAVSRMALMLEAYPKLVHLNEVGEDESN
jgi:hypothetical protein